MCQRQLYIRKNYPKEKNLLRVVLFCGDVFANKGFFFYSAFFIVRIAKLSAFSVVTEAEAQTEYTVSESRVIPS